MSAKLVSIDTEHERPHIKEVRVYYSDVDNRYYAVTEKVNGKTKMSKLFATFIEAMIDGRKVK